MADLLRGFVPEGPVREFDSDSLNAGPDDRVDGRLDRRQSDVTWTFALRNGARAVLIIEAQSTEDRAMAARMSVQTAMHCERHLRSAPLERLPGVLPIVFYTGRAPWRVAHSLADGSFARTSGLLPYFAASCYLLIEARRIPPESLPERNRVSLMIRMMRAEKAATLLDVLLSERTWLAREDAGLWRDYIAWAATVLAPLEFPDMDVEQLQSLQEGINMINEGVVRELEESRQKGLAEGLAEALAVPRSLLRHQIVWKFGDETLQRCADQLSDVGDEGRIEAVGRLIIDCRTGEEFLERL